MLLAPDKRLIVFVGYGGSDFFDVDPFLRTLARGSLAGRHVLWVTHCHTPARLPPTRRQLGWLKDAGATVIEVAAPTRDVLALLGGRWGIPLRELGGAAREWQRRIDVADAKCRRATLELYAVMGLHREVTRMSDPRDASEWELLAHTRWAEGRYRDAARAWARARTGASHAARAERAAATLWIRGRGNS